MNVLHSDAPVAWSADGGTSAAVAEPETETETLPVTVMLNEIREPYIEIRYAPDGERLVTSIEMLSLSNKTPGNAGQNLYLAKQEELLRSRVNLIEIDFLRGGAHSTCMAQEFMRGAAGPSTWHIVSRPTERRFYRLIYPIQIWHRLPKLEVPLLPEHGSVTVPLQPLMDRCYELGRYHLRAKYDEPVPPPALRPNEADYVARRLAAAFPDRPSPPTTS